MKNGLDPAFEGDDAQVMVASKFTTKRAERILQAASVGCSQSTCAAIAGVDQGTLSKWLTRGTKEFEEAEDDNLTAYAAFARDYAYAQAAPRERALGIIYREMEQSPALAWKFVERKEPGYAPPMPMAAEKPPGPVIIQLSLSDGAPLGHASAIEIGEVSESHDSAEPTSDRPANPDTPATVLSLAEGGSE